MARSTPFSHLVAENEDPKVASFFQNLGLPRLRRNTKRPLNLTSLTMPSASKLYIPSLFAHLLSNSGVGDPKIVPAITINNLLHHWLHLVYVIEQGHPAGVHSIFPAGTASS